MLPLFKVEHNQSGVRNPLTTYKFVRFADEIPLKGFSLMKIVLKWEVELTFGYIYFLFPVHMNF